MDEAAAEIICLGAGTQSTAMSLMAAEGVITPMPTAAIFADTGWESAGIYAHIDWLETMLPFPLYRVEGGGWGPKPQGDIRTKAGAQEMPVFVDKPKGRRGITSRHCTEHYKIVPIMRKSRELIGAKPVGMPKKGLYVNHWLGISTDEVERMRDSRVQWVHKRYPLIDMGFSRDDCIDYFKERFPGRELQRSACIGCPYHSNEEWERMKIYDPVSFADAVDFDHSMRNGKLQLAYKYPAYLHSDLMPLDEIDFNNPIRDSGFSAECEGMCGI